MEENDLLPRTAAVPQPKNAVKDSQPFTSSPERLKSGLNTSEKVADELPVPHPDTASGAPDQTKSTSENEVLGRAIDMIRSALEKRAE
jgi:hypothetical protein